MPSIKTKPGVPEKFGVYENTFGVPDLFTNGLVSSRSNADPTHPVARSELNVNSFYYILIALIFATLSSIVKMLIK